MKIVKLKGGIGNQLFQYVFAKYLEMKCDAEKVYLDLSAYGNKGRDANFRRPIIFRLNVSLEAAEESEISKICIFRHIRTSPNIIYKFFIILETLFNKNYYLQKRRHREFEEAMQYKYYDGYWQSYQYVENMKNVIKKEFYPRTGISTAVMEEMQNNAKESLVFVGIRRGDYIKKKNRKRYGVLTEEWYRSAMGIISKKVADPVFYVFSNDIEWVKTNMNFKPYTIRYRENEKQLDDLEELFVMSSCCHAIISNSTFYWWGAWLIDNPDKIVIAPRNWFADGTKSDIVPPEWIKI